MIPNANETKQIVVAVALLVLIGVVLNGLSSAVTETTPCDDQQQCPYPVSPPVDPPVADRSHNYAGGSCMHASLITLLRWQGREKTADYWRRNYRGGADVSDLARIADRLKLPYAVADRGDAGWMQWASDTGRGAAVHWHRGMGDGMHAVTFCGYHNGNALLIDNNRVRKYIKVPKQEFIDEWRVYGGFAITTVYSRPAPRPWRGV